MMIDIRGKKYINEKEASIRYGYSRSWFKSRRKKHLPPPFIKMENKGKILYPLIELDAWFDKIMGINE